MVACLALRDEQDHGAPLTVADGGELVGREKRRTPSNALAFWDLQVFAFARLLYATGENLANPLSR
jgi:hypothetical protein